MYPVNLLKVMPPEEFSDYITDLNKRILNLQEPLRKRRKFLWASYLVGFAILLFGLATIPITSKTDNTSVYVILAGAILCTVSLLAERLVFFRGYKSLLSQFDRMFDEINGETLSRGIQCKKLFTVFVFQFPTNVTLVNIDSS